MRRADGRSSSQQILLICEQSLFALFRHNYQIGVYGAKEATEAMDEVTEAIKATYETMEAAEEVTATTADPVGLGQARGASS